MIQTILDVVLYLDTHRRGGREDAIIVISLIPAVVEVVRARSEGRTAA
jgi:hypothetical protein